MEMSVVRKGCNNCGGADGELNRWKQCLQTVIRQVDKECSTVLCTNWYTHTKPGEAVQCTSGEVAEKSIMIGYPTQVPMDGLSDQYFQYFLWIDGTIDSGRELLLTSLLALAQ